MGKYLPGDPSYIEGLHHNFFDGYAIVCQPTPTGWEDVDLSLYLSCLEALCETPKWFEYMKKWIAMMLKDPCKRVDTAVFFMTEPRVGKNTLLERAIERIVGSDLVWCTKKADDLYGTRPQIGGKLLVIHDEPGNLWPYKDEIKNNITSTKAYKKPLYKEPSQVTNTAHFLYFTNDGRGGDQVCDMNNLRERTTGASCYIATMAAQIRKTHPEYDRPADAKTADENTVLAAMDYINEHQLTDDTFIYALYRFFESIDVSDFKPRKPPTNPSWNKQFKAPIVLRWLVQFLNTREGLYYMRRYQGKDRRTFGSAETVAPLHYDEEDRDFDWTQAEFVFHTDEVYKHYSRYCKDTGRDCIRGEPRSVDNFNELLHPSHFNGMTRFDDTDRRGKLRVHGSALVAAMRIKNWHGDTLEHVKGLERAEQEPSEGSKEEHAF